MLSTVRAQRLARRAARRRGDASHGRLARRAWRTLAVACDRGDQRAIGAVWRAWLRRPDDEWWGLLARSRNQADLAEAVFAAAADPARDAGSRAALGAFCARHGMSPDDDVRQVLFYALTGQLDQLRAADPGGTLLAVAYQAAAAPARAALRAALAAVTGLEYVRVLAAGYCRDSSQVPLGNEEARYLACQLAACGDWERLWRLIRDLPLAEAVAAMPHFGAGWRPADEAGRRLFTLLGGTSAATISAVAAEAVQRVRAGAGDRYGGVTFAPDGSEIAAGKRWIWTIAFAMTGIAGDPLGDATTTRYALPGGRRLRQYHAHPSRFLHLGESVAYVTGHKQYRVIRHGAHGREYLWAGKTWPYPRLREVPGGFVVNIGNRLLAGTAVAGTGLREVWPPDQDQERAGTRLAIRDLASDPVSGRLAIIAQQLGEPPSIIVLDAGFRVISQVAASDSPLPPLRFCGPDLLLGRLGGGSHLCSWQIGPPMTLAASTPLRALTIRPLPRSGLIAVDPLLRGSPRTWLDARTLTPAEGPPALRDASEFWVSPSGDHAAVQRPGELEVRDLRLDEIAGLIDQPLATACPADLATVAAAQALRLGPEANTAIGLLRACLEHRFGSP